MVKFSCVRVVGDPHILLVNALVVYILETPSKIIAIGCMSAQMDHEIKVGKPLAAPPKRKAMDRGDDTLNDDDDADAWWKKPQ